MKAGPPTPDGLPQLASVLSVCAHPDDESFGLGALLTAFADQGTATTGLCFTHGEASTLHSGDGELHLVRSRELEIAARALGMDAVRVLDYADGALSQVPLEELTGVVVATVRDAGAKGLLVFDDGGITGHPDHQRATDAALRAADLLGLPVLAWAIPDSVAATLNAEFETRFVGRAPDEMDASVAVDRRRQRKAIACHASQSTDNPVLWRRLDLLGDREAWRWLRDAVTFGTNGPPGM